ncbi:MAG: tetratricopeptide repeat protein [Candidatus Thorarchaeota archaeon]
MTISGRPVRPFFGREDILENIKRMLNKCSESSVIVGLHGMGGYGKTAILEVCAKFTTAYTVMFDFREKTDFYERLEIIAARARSVGLETPRYICLSDLRAWVLTGREPRTESGSWKESLGEIVMALGRLIPGVSTVVDIFKAMAMMAQKVNEVIERRYEELGSRVMKLINEHFRTAGEWLREQLGEDYGTRLLDLLIGRYTSDEYVARDLHMMAVVADLEQSSQRDTKPVMFLFDEFGEIDSTRRTGLKKNGVPLTEADLWQVRLSERSGFVLVVAARELPELPPKLGLIREDILVDRLDHDSCIRLIQSGGITDVELAERLTEICHQNPALIRMTTDAHKRGETTVSEIEDLRSRDFATVRINVWRFLMARIRHLEPLIIRAAFLPFFDENLLGVVWPNLTRSLWKETIDLSFVDRIDFHWRLHDLAKELAVAETGTRTRAIGTEIEEKLRELYSESQEHGLIGIVISVRGVVDESEAIDLLTEEVEQRIFRYQAQHGLDIVNSAHLKSESGRAYILAAKAQCLDKLHRPAEAEIAYKEALETYRRVAVADATFRPQVANTLFHLGNLYLSTGRPSEAERVYLEVLEFLGEPSETAGISGEFPEMATSRARVTEAPLVAAGVSVPFVAASATHSQYLIPGILHNLSLIYLKTGRPRESERFLLRALEIYRYLATSDSEKFEQYVADTLTNQGSLYRQTGRPHEAERAFNEALEIRRRLAKNDPDRFKPDMANILENLGILYRETGRPQEAERAFTEALEISRDLAETAPDQFRIKVASTLNDLADLYYRTHRLQESERAYLDALEIIKRLAEAAPERFELDKATTLNNLGLLYTDMGRQEKAEEALLESLEIRRRLARAIPSQFEPDLAMTLNNLGKLYLQMGRLQDAEPTFGEALNIYKRLAATAPEQFDSFLAGITSNLGVLYFRSNRPRESEKAFLEALDIYRQLADRAPEQFNSFVVMTLNNLARLYSVTNGPHDAARAYLESLEIARPLAEAAPDQFEDLLAEAVDGLGALYAMTNRFQEAEELLTQAAGIYRRLAKRSPGQHCENLAKTLLVLAITYGSKWDIEKAEHYFTESLQIAVRLNNTTSGTYSSLVNQVAKAFLGLYVQSGIGQERGVMRIRQLIQEAESMRSGPC